MKAIQKTIAGQLFPSNRADWYIEQGFGDEESAKSDFHQPFNQFIAAIADGRTSDYDFLKSFSTDRLLAIPHVKERKHGENNLIPILS